LTIASLCTGELVIIWGHFTSPEDRKSNTKAGHGKVPTELLNTIVNWQLD